MVEQLFGSKTRVKLLQLFYTNPNRPFYVREITRKVEEQINSVRRELSNLLSIGIITSDANNNRLYYEVNQKYEHYDALKKIFGGVSEPVDSAPTQSKSAGKPTKQTSQRVSHPLAKDFQAIGKVDLVIFTGQFTRDDLSGADILIVGDVNQAKTAKLITELEKTENKELRYVVMSLDDYQYRVQINDRFIVNLLNSKKQVIINAQDLPIK